MRTPKAGASDGYQLHDRDYRILLLGRRCGERSVGK